MPQPPNDLLVAASADQTIAVELDKAAAHFEALGEVTVVRALREQARELEGQMMRLHAQAGAPSNPEANDN